MTNLKSLQVACTLASLLICGQASAVNNTPGTATRMPIDTDWVNSNFTTTIAARWYYIGLINGRSYCVVTAPNENTIDNTTVDNTTTVYSDTAGTVQISYNDDNSNEPVSSYYSRNCFIYTATSNTYATLKVALFGGGAPSTTTYFRFKVVDTTLTGPWWYVDGPSSYNAFIELANTTNTSVSVRIRARTGGGAQVGSDYTATIPAYGNLAINAANAFGVTVTNGSGQVQIAHSGAPGAIVANVTSMSALTGLSFDAPATRRQNW